MNNQQPSNTSTPIETREIRGISAKVVIWLFSTLGTILISIVWTYATINYKLEKSADAVVEMKNDKMQMQLEIAKLREQHQADVNKIVNAQQNTDIRILTLEVQLKGKGVIDANF